MYVPVKATQITFFSAGDVGDCGEAYLGAESGEEFMLVDKEAIYC
jgi:hypothetical protein